LPLTIASKWTAFSFWRLLSDNDLEEQKVREVEDEAYKMQQTLTSLIFDYLIWSGKEMHELSGQF
jgi:hypothetical protein